MKQNTRAYGLLLLVMSLILTAALSVGTAQARYENMDVWNTLISHTPQQTLYADCLVEGGQVILLNDLTETREITFSLKTMEDVEQLLTWTCDQSDYLNVTIAVVTEEGEAPVAPSVPLKLTAESEAEIRMALTPADVAHEALPVNVTVSFGTLSGTFRTTIPELVIDEVTDPQEETTDPSEDTTDPSEEPTDPSEDNAEPIIDQPEPSDPAPDAALTTVEEQPSDPEEPEQPEELTLPAPEVQMPASFLPDGMLPVVITLPENTDRVQVGLAVEQTEEMITEPETVEQVTVVQSPFMEGTRYQVNDTWYLLYDGGYITANEPMKLLLDVSSLALTEDGFLELMAQAYQGETNMGQTVVSAAADTGLDGAEKPKFLPKAANLAEAASFEIDLPKGWMDGNVTMQHKVEMLYSGENGTAWQPVDLSVANTGLGAVYLCDTENDVHSMSVFLTEPNPPAGTYRLTMQWFYQDLCFEQSRTIFFVNDSATVKPSESVEESTAETEPEADVEQGSGSGE